VGVRFAVREVNAQLRDFRRLRGRVAKLALDERVHLDVVFVFVTGLFVSVRVRWDAHCLCHLRIYTYALRVLNTLHYIVDCNVYRKI